MNCEAWVPESVHLKQTLKVCLLFIKKAVTGQRTRAPSQASVPGKDMRCRILLVSFKRSNFCCCSDEEGLVLNEKKSQTTYNSQSLTGGCLCFTYKEIKFSVNKLL